MNYSSLSGESMGGSNFASVDMGYSTGAGINPVYQFGQANEDCAPCRVGSGMGQMMNSPQMGGVSTYANGGSVGRQAFPTLQREQSINQIGAVNDGLSEVDRKLLQYLKQEVEKLSYQLRSKPDSLDLSPDGGATWKYSSMIQGGSIWCKCFTKIEVQAERKAYKYPLPHLTNVVTTTKIKLDPDLVTELQKEFPMISYCQSTKTLTISMDSLEHNLAMLCLICQAQKGNMKMSKIKYYSLAKKYMLLTTPNHPKYQAGAKYSMIRAIRK